MTELIQGKGAAVQENSQVKVRFTCKVDGHKDAIATNSDFEFTMGSEQIIKGWNIGLIGAKKGSRRVVHCPPDVAYGKVGCPPIIPPNSALSYTFDIISIKNGK